MKKIIQEDSGWTLDGPNKPYTFYVSDISTETYCVAIEPTVCMFCDKDKICITCDMGMDGFSICLSCLFQASKDIVEYSHIVDTPRVLKEILG